MISDPSVTGVPNCLHDLWPGTLGMDVTKLNVRVELDGAAGDAMPKEVPIEVMAREPGFHRPTQSSMSTPFKTKALRQGTTLTYTVSVDPSSLAPFMKSV